MNNKLKNSLPLALFISFAICLAGAIVWGLMYQLGVFSTIIATISAALAIVVYRKYYKINWFTYIWVSIWSILLNEISMLFVETFFAMKELNIGFSEGFKTICTLIANNEEAKSIFVSNTIWSIVFSLIGVIIILISIKRNIKNAQFVQESLQNADTQKVYTIDEKFTMTLSSFKIIVDTYNNDKDKEKFKTSASKLIDGLLSNIDLLEKEQIKLKIKEQLNKPDTSEQDKKVLKIMDKLI